jgi:hypothetical protein
VTDYVNNAPVLQPVSIEWDLPTGAVEGDLIQREGLVVTTLASRVTGFQVRRQGELVRLRVATAAGPADDRRRTATTTFDVAPRND